MPKILKHGNRCRKYTCEKCGCIFEYLEKEIYHTYHETRDYVYQTWTITCPECDNINIIKELKDEYDT